MVISAEIWKNHDQNENAIRCLKFESIASVLFPKFVSNYISPHEINFPCDRQRTVPASNKVTRNLSRFRARFNIPCMRSRRRRGQVESRTAWSYRIIEFEAAGVRNDPSPMVSSLFSFNIDRPHDQSARRKSVNERILSSVLRISNLFLFPDTHFPFSTNDNSIFVSFFFLVSNEGKWEVKWCCLMIPKRVGNWNSSRVETLSITTCDGKSN